MANETLPSHLLVVDFEATCADDGSVPRAAMEIIEVGAVMVAADGFRPVDEFQSFVRPVRHPRLTPFCTRLTTIRQQDVDAAPGFAEVAAAWKHWLQPYPGFVFCSWGDYDRNQLRQDCDFHCLPCPLGAEHRNLKRLFAERQGLAKKQGLGQALGLAGFDFIGTAHRGIDDARNMVRLLPYIFGTEKLLGKPE